MRTTANKVEVFTFPNHVLSLTIFTHRVLSATICQMEMGNPG